VPGIGAWLRGLRYDLPRGVYVLQAGLLINAFGNGAANPFLLLYLHNVRGIPLVVAGLVSASGAVCALVLTLAAGSIADRRGAVPTMIAGLVCSAFAFALYPLIRLPWHAFVVATLAWSGAGVWLTMQSSVLALITPPQLRHAAFAQQRVVANVGLGVGGFVGGMIVTTSRPSTFTVLFLLNAITFLAYTGFLLRLTLPRTPRQALTGAAAGYRAVLRDGGYRRLAVVNLAVIVGAISLLNGVFPVYAKNHAGVSESAIGAFFLLNSVTIIVCQLPVARAVEGHRRVRALTLMGALFAACWLQVAAAGALTDATFVLLALACGIITMSLAECLYDAVLAPLTADLAPEGLLGRYMAVNGFIWQIGFIAGPPIGALLLATTGSGLWYIMAVLCAIGGGYALLLERRLPHHAQRTPRRAPAVVAEAP